MALSKLLRDLEKGLSPVYVVLGGETLLVDKAEAAIAAAALSGGGAAFNRDSFRAGEEGAEESLAVARTLPMLAARRLVLLRDAHAAPVALLEQLAEYCASPNPSTVLVVTGLKWPKPAGGKDWGRRAENAARKTGQVLKMKTGVQDPIRFAVQTAEGFGCSLGRRDAALLVELVGTNLSQLKQEIEKAAIYAGGEGPISADDLRAVCSLLAEADVWDLANALVARSPGPALATAHRLMEAGEPPHRLLTSITWQLRQLLKLQEAMRKGRSPWDAGIRMRKDKMRAAQDRLRKHPIDPAGVLDTLARANEAMNSHKAGHRRIFEGLLLELLSARRG